MGNLRNGIYYIGLTPVPRVRLTETRARDDDEMKDADRDQD